ncbi:hypothetical protein [Roseateles sp.]|uniref:hypothetical protein n=1 Tax=Roseateles sp. TaxID=1971397 RepID=UPI003266C154
MNARLAAQYRYALVSPNAERLLQTYDAAEAHIRNGHISVPRFSGLLGSCTPIAEVQDL